MNVFRFTRPRWIKAVWCCLLAWLLLPVVSVSSQSSVASLVITQVDASRFPEIVLQLMALDSQGVPPPTLTSNDIKVAENQNGIANVTVSTKPVGVQVAWVIDAGGGISARGATANSRMDEAKEIILEFVDTGRWMQAGLDATMVLARTQSETVSITGMTTDTAEVATKLRAYNPPVGQVRCSVLQGVSEALDQLHNSTTGQDQARLVIALVQCAEIGTAQFKAVVKKSQDLHIPVHFILLRSAGDEQTLFGDDLPRLATQMGGDYLRYKDLKTVTSSFFPDIAKRRTQFTVVYRSAVSQSSAVTVITQLNTSAEGAPSATGTYSIDISAPVVQIIEPLPGGAPLLCSSSDSLGRACKVDPALKMVVAQVTWPDNHPRQLNRAELLVNEAVVGSPVLNPSDPSRIEIPWDLSGHTGGADTTFSLRVSVEDELHLSNASDPLPVLVKFQSAAGICRMLTFIKEPYCSYINALTPYSSVVIALIALAFAAYIWFNRAKIVPAVQGRVQEFTDFVDRVTGRRTAQTPKAYLIPLAGLEDGENREFEIYGQTAIGRSRKSADLIFHANEEDSAISRLHCTLMDEEDHFTIRDDDSANGTYLNRVKLDPLEPTPLNNGDEIELGRVERGGVRLQFKLADDGYQPADLGNTRRMSHDSPEDLNGEDDLTQVGVAEEYDPRATRQRRG